MDQAPIPSQGLTREQVEQRIREGAVNHAPSAQWRDYGLIVARNLFTWFNGMVAPAAITLIWLRDYQAAIAVSGMALANTILSLLQELRAKRHLDRLAILTESRARVVRDGELVDIAARDVVLGDHICLQTGDALVADGEVLHARFLEVDEALLTGESDPVRRQVGDRVLSGSACVAGEGVYRADNVGANAYAQSLTQQARQYSSLSSPLTRHINRIVRYLTYAVVSLCALYLGAAWWSGWPEGPAEQRDLVRMIAATITSMVPQGLILTATVAFTLGAISMSLRGAIVQKLSAVETMAAVDVICTDKTGTLTTNRLKLESLIALHGSDHDVRERLRWFANASIDQNNRSVQAVRETFGPLEATSNGQVPFKSQNRYSAVRTPEGDRWFVLGAPEALQARIETWEREHGAERPFRDLFQQALHDAKNAGVRYLAFGEMIWAGAPSATEAPALPEQAVRPWALIGLSDELRPDAAQVLEALHDQNIQFKVISGDNPETVRGTVSHLNLPLARDPVVAGSELMDGDAENRILAGSVFGRVSPAQKVQIVETLQKAGRCVAMIGDGINDVLPLKKADLGIAMGAGSQASKTVAGLVLLNNDFALLPETLDEGRIILRNLRRSGKLILAKNVYSLILILLYYIGWFGIPFPYVPQHVTLVNWAVIGVPSIAIALAREPSRRAVKVDFLREVLGFAIKMGLLVGLAGFAVLMFGGWWAPDDERLHRTMLCSLLVLTGVGTLFQTMDDTAEPATGTSRRIPWIVLGIAVPILLLGMYVPVLSRFFELVPLDAGPWIAVLALAALVRGISIACRRYL